MRWFYVPNEKTEGDQIGPRMAFESLHRDGVLSAYAAYSYLVRRAETGSHQDALDEFFDRARRFDPDVIFIQHPGDSFPIDRTFLRKLKSLPRTPRLALYEEDPYARLFKRMNGTIKAVLAESDICFLGGTGYYAELARAAGAGRVRHAKHSYDSQRFGTPWTPTLKRSFDAVMIANLTCIKSIPWLFMPGGRGRKLTARTLHDYLGDRFALFGGGQGWEGEPYCRGRLPFDRQGAVIRDAWMSVNWGQFDDIPMYSSDRLPISLACGVPHITNYQPGYEHIFGRVPGLFTVRTPRETLDVAIYILSLPVERRNELGFEAATYARLHLEATVVYRDIVAVVQEQLFGAKLDRPPEAHQP